MNAARPSVLWIATLAVVIVVVVLLHGILLPFVAGIALAYLLNPLVARLERLELNRAVPRWASSACSSSGLECWPFLS